MQTNRSGNIMDVTILTASFEKERKKKKALAFFILFFFKLLYGSKSTACSL